MTKLDLGDNRISDVGAKRLAWAIQAVSRLTELDLSENPYIGPASGQAFFDGLVMNTTLVILGLKATNVGSHAEARIGEALLDNIEKKISQNVKDRGSGRLETCPLRAHHGGAGTGQWWG